MNVIRFDKIYLNMPDLNDEINHMFESMLDINTLDIISFINPEIFLAQQKDNILEDYFLNCKYNFIDGIGILKAINIKMKSRYSYKNRFAGTDFFSYLPANREISLFLYGSSLKNLIKAKNIIESTYKNIHINDCLDGYSNYDDKYIVEKMNNSKSDIIIVCLGCPKQEYWIRKNHKDINSKLIFGNGGSVDFWSGNVKRAPVLIRKVGLEWAFRLVNNFSVVRLRRQLKLIKFFIKYNKKKYDIEYV